MVVNISAYMKFSAPCAVGGDVEIFRANFLGDDRDEKIDFRIIALRAPRYVKRGQTKFLGGNLDEKIDF